MTVGVKVRHLLKPKWKNTASGRRLAEDDVQQFVDTYGFFTFFNGTITSFEQIVNEINDGTIIFISLSEFAKAFGLNETWWVAFIALLCAGTVNVGYILYTLFKPLTKEDREKLKDKAKEAANKAKQKAKSLVNEAKKAGQKLRKTGRIKDGEFDSLIKISADNKNKKPKLSKGLYAGLHLLVGIVLLVCLVIASKEDYWSWTSVYTIGTFVWVFIFLVWSIKLLINHLLGEQKYEQVENPINYKA